MSTAPASDLTRTTLQLLCIGALLAGSLWILRPFLMPQKLLLPNRLLR